MPFFGEPVDDRPERRAQARLGNMPEREIDPACGRAASGLDFLEDGVGREVARRLVGAVLGDAIGVDELGTLGIEQPPAELVAERVPHDRVHADEARRQVPDRKELHEFHVDEPRARAQRQRVAVAAHVGRGAVAAVEPREPAGRDHHGLRRDRDFSSVAYGKADGARGLAVHDGEIGDAEIADAADAPLALHLAAQGARHGRPGRKEIDIDAARAVMARRMGLADAAVAVPRPADMPAVHAADRVGPVLAQDGGQALVA